MSRFEEVFMKLTSTELERMLLIGRVMLSISKQMESLLIQEDDTWKSKALGENENGELL